MATAQITLDDRTHAETEARAIAAGYGTVEDYITALIDEDARTRRLARLDEMLIEAIESSEATEMTKADWDRIRAAVRQRLSKDSK